MKESYWGYWIVLLGVFIIVIMMLIQNVTSNSTEDHYKLKQITEAAMIDSVDYAYYREYGELKINKEKFIESFLRRFGDIASLTDEYKINFTGVYEAPPKVSVEIITNTTPITINSDTTTFDMVSRVDGLLEQGS